MNDRAKKFIASVNSLSITIKSFLIIVALPTFLAILYFGLIASDVYISEAKYALRTSSETPSLGLIDSFLGGTTISTSGSDEYIVRDYILSREMLGKLDKELDLKHHYQSGDIDLFSRLSKDASTEDFYEYYQKMVGIQIESNGGISSLTVRSYTPEFGQKVAQLIIRNSEDLINSLNQRIIDDTLKFARREVDKAGDKVKNATEEISSFRNKSKSIDPAQETTGVLKIVIELEGELAKSRAELIQAESYMKPDSLQVKNLRSKVDALKTQIDNERNRLASEDENGKDMNTLIYT